MSAKLTKELRQHFIFKVLTVNVVTFVRMWLFLEVKNIVNLRETCFFRKRVCLHMRSCGVLRRAEPANSCPQNILDQIQIFRSKHFQRTR